MEFVEYAVTEKIQEAGDVFVFRAKSVNGSLLSFLPGQYVLVKNPTYDKPGEMHAFSLSSSPQDPYLEIGMRVYGNWTQAFAKKNKDDHILLSGPFGQFIWKDTITNAVCLLGGIGVTPVMSMLRYIKQMGQHPKLTMIYGNRTPSTIAFKKELEQLAGEIPLKIVHVFSEVAESEPLMLGFKGFITKEIIEKEADLSQNPYFFCAGPNVFMEKMKAVLSQLNVSPDHQITERF